ncbi:MAG: hypothetical protein Q7K38_00275 [Candidatus Wildermuthbacteria bacterium]|nr:hypothetical protein [Candidatus Wildermuthbacteria bacterium]
MVKKRYEHKDPIIRDVHSVVQGNLYVGRKALTGGGLFVPPHNFMTLVDFVSINNLWWWGIVALNFLGYFLLRYGMINNGRKRIQVEFLGGVIIAVSLFLITIFFGILHFFSLVIIFWFINTPVVELLIRKVYEKMFAIPGESWEEKEEFIRRGHESEDEAMERIMKEWKNSTKKEKRL